MGDDDSLILPERFAFIFKSEAERAATARPSEQYKQSPQSIADKSVVVMDCGQCGVSQTASTVLRSRSMLNSRDAIEKQTRIVTADGRESMMDGQARGQTA